MKSFYFKQPHADEQVGATIDGRKTLMVLPVKIQPNTDQYVISRIACSTDRKERGKYRWVLTNDEKTIILKSSETFKSPFDVGERYWLKEAFCESFLGFIYRADVIGPKGIWNQSIRMPQHASRCTIEVKRVYVKRVQDMTQEENDKFSFANGGIDYQWRYNLDFWDRNDWCWFVEFEVVK